MTTMRVTQGLRVLRSLNDLNYQTSRLLELQEQLATGLKVNSPSDDPLAARRAINIRNAIAKNEQYITNITSISPQLLETVSAVQTVESNLQRVLELTVEGANGTYDQSQRDLIATEIDQLLEEMLTQANHQTNGRYVFGGTRTTEAPFEATRDADGEITAVTYLGNDERTQIAISDGITIDANETGQDAFLAGQDVFQLLIDIRDNLRAGDQNALQTRLAEIEVTQDQLLTSVSRIGAIQNRAERVTNNLYDYNLQLEEALSDNIDADYAETVVSIDAQSNAFQAALSATARVIQPSLLDYVS